MAAGRGTRLAPLTDVVPKPALPIVGEPVMGRLLRLLARHGVQDVVANSSYLADVLESIIGDGSAHGVRLTWSREREPLGTAGGVRAAEPLLRDGDEPVLILSADGLHELDLSRLVAAHRSSGALVTMALTRVDDPSQYGVVVTDSDGWVTQFQEKPARDQVLSDCANTGIYVVSSEAFDEMPPAGEFYDFGNELLPKLVERRARVLGVEMSGYWNDIGGHHAFREASFALLDGRLGSLDDAAEQLHGDQVYVHPTAVVGADVGITGPAVIEAGARIDAGARIARSVVLPGAHVPADTMLAGATFGSTTGLQSWARSLGALTASSA